MSSQVWSHLRMCCLPLIKQALWISLDRDEAELADPFDLDSPENPSFMAW